MALEPERRAALERARAVGLLRTCFDLEPTRVEVDELPFGVVARAGTERGWVVSMADDVGLLGGVLVWADRLGLSRVDVVVDHNAGVLARRAAALAPELTVWQAVQDRVVQAVADPLPLPLPRPSDAGHLEQLLADAGLEVVCEGGILRGELAGLEVARILPGPDGPVLEVGVGRFDREAGALLHAGRDPARALRDVIGLVGPHRRVGAAGHPMGRIGRSRWLRSLVVADPALVGVSDPRPVEAIPPRATLREEAPAAATARAETAGTVLVVCTAGVDLGLVPEVADLVARHIPDEVRVVLPARDRLRSVETLARRLRLPVKFVDLDPPW